MSYYGFPLMVGLCWPMIVAHCRPGIGWRTPISLLAVNVVLSVVLFAFSGGMHDRRPWQSFGLPKQTRIAATEAALDKIIASRAQLGPLIVDDAVGALRPSAFYRSELRILMDFTESEIKALHVMVFMPVGWLAERKKRIISAANLSWHYRIPGTKLLLYSFAPLDGFRILEPTD
jgi:hypothetical protein